MKLSIIIPAYNAGSTLCRCLDSIPKSHDIEVIVVNDGSTDETMDIITEYLYDVENYPNFFFDNTRERSGVSHARNIGLSMALGDYITFLDADDEYYPGAVDNMLEVIDKRNEPVIQFNHSRSQFSNKRGFYTLNNLPKKWVLVWNKVYSRKFLSDYGILFRKGLQFEEDRIFNLQCLNYLEGIYNEEYPTVIKRFVNEKSLCRSVDERNMFFLTENLIGLLTYSKPEVKAITRKCIADLWKSQNAIRLFGGEP